MKSKIKSLLRLGPKCYGISLAVLCALGVSAQIAFAEPPPWAPAGPPITPPGQISTDGAQPGPTP